MQGGHPMNGERDRIIQERINDIGRKSFPDDSDVTWTTLRIAHVGSYSYVEAEADPATVGYPKFIFVLLFGESDQPTEVGCYEGDGTQWGLLFTVPNTPSDWQDLFPKAEFTERIGRFSSHQRERIIREKINDICRESFPEDTDVSWTVLKMVHESKYSFVECEPDSPEVGYPKFVLVLTFTESGKPYEEGCYAFERKCWELLSSSSDPSDWQDLFPEFDLGRKLTKRSEFFRSAAGTVLALLALGTAILWAWWFFLR
jgi:hypothetical protein